MPVCILVDQVNYTAVFEGQRDAEGVALKLKKIYIQEGNMLVMTTLRG